MPYAMQSYSFVQDFNSSNVPRVFERPIPKTKRTVHYLFYSAGQSRAYFLKITVFVCIHCSSARDLQRDCSTKKTESKITLQGEFQRAEKNTKAILSKINSYSPSSYAFSVLVSAVINRANKYYEYILIRASPLV